jgi:NADH-quinone oxidoreductase subunit J
MLIILNQIQNTFINAIMLFMLLSVFLIIVQKNPVYAVFSFILTALFTFLFLLLIGAEFLALLILIIYTGVITVLFLFVVIMYNLRDINISKAVTHFILDPSISILAFKIYWANKICYNNLHPLLVQTISINTENFYTLDVIQFIALFNEHYLIFLFCGLLIFIAMIGSIVITYPFYKYQ